MIKRLCVLHSRQSGALDTLPSQWLLWKTCLRQIAVGDSQWGHKGSSESVDAYYGADAYRFLLEVSSGLHSPLIGETEVFGQYRKFIFEASYPSCDWGAYIQNLLEQIRLEVKKIRKSYLIGLGSQSYGSLIRRKTKGSSSVHFLGSGQLTQEILPWLAKFEGSVLIHCRNPEKYKSLQKEFPFARWVDLKDPTVSIDGDLVVCAPMSANKVSEWAYSKFGLPAKIYDLRGESKGDPLQVEHRVQCLTSLFSEIESAKDEAHQKVQKAHTQIREFAENTILR